MKNNITFEEYYDIYYKISKSKKRFAFLMI